MKARILESQTYIYSEPDLNSQPVTQVFGGQEVDLGAVKKKDGANWVKVKTVNGQEGYLPGTSKVFIIKLASLLQNNAKVYSSPNPASIQKMEFKKNDKFYLMEVVKQEDGKDWVKVRDMRGNEGYIEGSTKIKRETMKSRAVAVRNMRNGAVWFILGVVVTVGTMTIASNGGTYVVAWGAIIFGGIQFVQGLFQYFSAND